MKEFVSDESSQDEGSTDSYLSVKDVVASLHDTPVFRDFSDEPYAVLNVNGVHQVHRLSSDAFRGAVTLRCYRWSGRTPSRSTVNTVVDLLTARASMKEPEEVFLRVARIGPKTYLDLCDSTWRVIEIDADGYRILDRSPVHFRRTKGMRPLPEPVAGGNLHDLGRVVNLDADDLDVLVIALLSFFQVGGPFPVLDVNGEQGSGKTTACKIVRTLIDPHVVALRGDPRDPRDLHVAADNAWIVNLDNLSSMPKGLADAICRMSTGAGASYRQNYSDRDEALFSICRPVILNGIDDLDDRHDLRDRYLMVSCSPMVDGQRRTDADVMAEFDRLHPALLGALLDAEAMALRRQPEVAAEKHRLPRLADVALHAEAAAPSLGWEKGHAIELLRDRQAAARRETLLCDPVARAVAAFAKERCSRFAWKGRASELLEALSSSNDGILPTGVPDTPNHLSNRLNRVTPALREIGVSVCRSRTGREGKKLITIEMKPQQEPDESPTTDRLAIA